MIQLFSLIYSEHAPLWIKGGQSFPYARENWNEVTKALVRDSLFNASFAYRLLVKDRKVSLSIIRRCSFETRKNTYKSFESWSKKRENFIERLNVIIRRMGWQSFRSKTKILIRPKEDQACSAFLLVPINVFFLSLSFSKKKNPCHTPIFLSLSFSRGNAEGKYAFKRARSPRLV